MKTYYPISDYFQFIARQREEASKHEIKNTKKDRIRDSKRAKAEIFS
ncbi:MAG: hypothetical protein ACK4ND_01700 [Cytophagaceae bacterium]